LKSWIQGKYIKVEDGMVRFDGSGFNEASRIEQEKGQSPKTEKHIQPGFFGGAAKAGK
jgi:hypothetical protein